MIEVTDLTKRFGAFKALDGVNMNVGAGAVYGLVGPNGAGKSTIIRHLVGAYSPDAGEVKIGGEEVYENTAVKARIAYIPDDFYYFPQDTVNDLMKFYAALYPTFDKALFEKIRECFPTVDMKKQIRRMSKGMQKQVAFWMAIAIRPQVMILDEPVDGLDPVMRRQIWSLVMSDVAQDGTSVLVSSHNLRELEDVCDHVGIMNHGKVIIERSLEELQGSVMKLQVAFEDEMPALPDNIKVLHEIRTGRVHTLIVRSQKEEALAAIRAMNPLLMDILPLSLEEIFIYEMGGEEYEVREIIF